MKGPECNLNHYNYSDNNNNGDSAMVSSTTNTLYQ